MRTELPAIGDTDVPTPEGEVVQERLRSGVPELRVPPHVGPEVKEEMAPHRGRLRPGALL